MRWLSFIVFSFMALEQSFALECDPRRETIGQARFEVLNIVADTCWLSLAPEWVESGVYRSFLFDEHGYVMIFNSYGYGDESKTTGAREYVFFPRSKELGYKINGARVTISLRNGAEVDYDGAALKFAGSRGLHLKESSSIHPRNKGGVELSPKSGMMIDFGFRMGSSPMANKKGSAEIIDAAGHRCRVLNNEVLGWKTDGEPYVKFKTDEEFFEFVRRRCSTLS